MRGASERHPRPPCPPTTTISLRPAIRLPFWSQMPPRVDLVIVIRTLPKAAVDKSKQVLVQRAQEAERQYTRLAKELKGEGLKVVARRGEDVGEILVFVGCSDELLTYVHSSRTLNHFVCHFSRFLLIYR